MSMQAKILLIDKNDVQLSIRQQCKLLGLLQRAKFLDHFFEKLRYKISVMFMLKYSHGTAWEGDDRDVILGSICCPDPFHPRYESRLQISRGLGQSPI